MNSSGTIGRIMLDLGINKTGFNKDLQGVTKTLDTQLGGSLASIGKKMASAFAVSKMVDFAKSCIDLGSDLSEVQNVVDVTFGSLSGQINEFAQSAIDTFGLSETVAKKYTGTLGAMAKSFGFSTKEALDMSETLTGLAGDVASFYNLSSDEAFNKLKSVFTGETESLKELGVVMTQTALDQFALANGFGKTTKSMSENEKASLRYQFVLDKLSAASGDFARTSDGWANQTRVLSLRFDQLKATLGQGLINIFTPVIKVINRVVAGLSILAQKFLQFTELITGKKASADISGSLGAIDESVQGMSSGADELSESTAGLGKAAKNAAKEAAIGLAGFDKLNNVNDSKSDSGSGSGEGAGGAGSGLGAGLVNDMSSAVDESSNKMSESIQRVIDKAKELADLFKEGFKLGLGDLNFDDINSNIKNIGKSLQDIFTDKKVLKAGNNWLKSMAKSAGKVAGSFASVGLTIAELVSGGISKYLEQNKDFLKDRLVNMFDISSKRAEILSNFAVAVSDVFSIFRGDEAQQIYADLTAIFTNTALSINEITSQLGNDILDTIISPLIENKDKISEGLNGTLEVVQTVVGTVKDFLNNTFDTIRTKYDEYITPAFNDIKEGLSKIVSHVLDAYNKHIQPTLQMAADELDKVVKNYIQPAVDAIIDCIGSIIKNITEVWNKTLAPFIAWLVDTLGPIVAGVIDDIVKVASSLFKTVSQIIKDIAEFVKELFNTIKSLFTGDLEGVVDGVKGMLDSAWQAVKDIFAGVGDYFKTIFQNAADNIKNIFSPIGEWFKNRWSDIKGAFASVGSWFSSKFSTAWKGIKNAFSLDNVKTFFSGIWSGIKGCFGKVGSWFKDTFSKAWQKVKDVFCTGGKIFSGIKEGLANVFKSVVQKIIDGMNTIIATPFKKINGMLNKIRNVDIFGLGKPFSGLWSQDPLPVPQIPPLAQGGYVKANTPQLVMIGDNRHQGEVVAPEDKLQSLLDKAVSSNNMSSLQMAELLAILRDILRILGFISEKDNSVYIGDTVLGKAVQRFAKAYKQSTGKEAF